MTGSPGGIGRVASDAVALITSAYVSQFVVLILAFALRHALGPVEMGYFALTQIATLYAPYVGLGALQAAEREVSSSLGLDHPTEALDLEAAGLAMALLLAIAVATVLALFAVTLMDENPDLAATAATIGAIFVGQQLAIAATVRLRTRYRFAVLGWVSAAGSVAVTSIALIGAELAGLQGALLGVVLGTGVQAALLSTIAGFPRWVRPTRRSVERLAYLSPGFLGVGLATIAFATVDQLAVGSLLGASALGLYSAAYLGNGFALRVPTLMNATIYPRLQRQLAASANRATTYAISIRATGVTVMVVAMVVLGFSVVLPAAVWAFLPDFVESVPAMRLLLVGVLGMAFAMPGIQFLIAADRQWMVMWITAAGVAGMALVYVAASQLGAMSIEFAAAVDAAVYLTFGAIIQGRAATAGGQPFLVGLRGLPFLVVVGLVSLVLGIGADSALSSALDPLRFALVLVIQGVLVLLVAVPAAVVYVRFNPGVGADAREIISLGFRRVSRLNDSR
jgi:PST family polysaccharide transporter